MIKHIVLFKLKEFNNDEEKQVALNHLANQLLELRSLIPELKFIEVGKNYQLNAASFDLCLISHFETIDDLNVYQSHPEHLKVGDYVKTISTERAAVDFEI
ncbi:MAG: Dabb family protein [Prolixibacteraceae bacterium]